MPFPNLSPDYKIGLLSRMFHITPGTIRYYEEKNLLSASRTVDSSTRRYHARLVKILFSIRRYLSMGFQVNEIQKLFSCQSKEEISAQLVRKQDTLRREIERLSEQLDSIRVSIDDISRIDSLLGRCETAECPELIFFCNQTGGKLNEDESSISASREFLRSLPHVFPAHLYRLAPPPDNSFSGFCVFPEHLPAQFPFPCSLIRLRPCLCIHSIMEMKAEEPFRSPEEWFAPWQEYARQNGLILCGDAFGRDLVRVHENNCFDTSKPDQFYVPKSLYYEFWVPVKKISEES